MRTLGITATIPVVSEVEHGLKSSVNYVYRRNKHEG